MSPLRKCLLIIQWFVLEFCLLDCGFSQENYFPPSDADGGWRRLTDRTQILSSTGVDVEKLDRAYELVQQSTKNGGLLVVRRGWLVYERYFGLGHREATPNLASCGKSFTSIAVGILMQDRPDLFPAGLKQRIFTPDYFPPAAFPLADPRMENIMLGQLLSFSAGIRGNNPCYKNGQPINIEPAGHDGSSAMIDAVALGRRDITKANGQKLSTSRLWCEPGGGYSYATSSIHLASMMVRHITGNEMEVLIRKRIAQPLGWGRWGFGYQQSKMQHTPGGGGICVRATDMLRFGYLLLREGRWANNAIVPADYVKHCSSQSPFNPHFPYSLQFNVNTRGEQTDLPTDAFWKAGSGGHALYIVPSMDLVVWKLGGRDGQYSPSDTGIDLSPESPRDNPSRAQWRESISSDMATIETLRMVVRAIKRQ